MALKEAKKESREHTAKLQTTEFKETEAPRKTIPASSSTEESNEAAPSDPQTKAQRRSPTLSRRRSSKTIASDHSERICPSIRPNDGAGHGLRLLKRQTSISRDYEIKDVPKNKFLRESDSSADGFNKTGVKDVIVATYRGDGGKRGPTCKRRYSAPRMRASERIAMRKVMSGGNDRTERKKRNDSWDGQLIMYAQSAQLGRKSGDGDQENCDEGNEKSDDDDVSGCLLSDSGPQAGRKQQSEKNQLSETKHPTESNTEAILADYIQLKLQVAELQSKLQHQALEFKELTHQNSMLQRENVELSERNRILLEENYRLDQSQHSGLLGMCRRLSLQEEAMPKAAPKVPKKNMSWLRLAAFDDKVDETDKPVTRKSEPWGFLPLFGDGKDDEGGKRTSTRLQNGESSFAPEQQMPAPPKIEPVRRRSSLSEFKPESKNPNENKSVPSNDTRRDQVKLDASTKTIKATNPLRSHEANKQEPRCSISIGETSCETAPSVVILEQTIPDDHECRSPTGDELCYSIQADSVTSGYDDCEFSVVGGL